ncbi:MAG: hypothetical protein Q7R30_13860 [Acidobacteriota bacterium]|nr:hypothetical protein [Acidobacteriota bacterium]
MRRSNCFWTWVLASGTLLAAVSVGVEADDPVSSSVRFNREIIRILQRRCLPCHLPGTLAMPLATYRDVREWSRAIREEVVEQRMPPSTAAPGYGRFENALGLTSRETTTLLSWLDGGMPRGDERDLPASLDPGAGEAANDPAHARFDLPEQSIPAIEELVVRRVVVDPRLTADRLVSRVVVRPGSRAVLRGALVYAGPGEQSWVGGWLPWQHTFVAPANHAFVLAKGASLTIVLYYRGGDQPAVDRSSVELHFAREPSRPLDSLRIETAAGQAGSLTSPANGLGRLTLPAPTTIWALQPVIGATTQSLELRAERPDGAIDVLLWMPTVRPEWPNVLILQQPAVLPAGTVLRLSTRRADAASAPDRIILSAWREER